MKIIKICKGLYQHKDTRGNLWTIEQRESLEFGDKIWTFFKNTDVAHDVFSTKREAVAGLRIAIASESHVTKVNPQAKRGTKRATMPSKAIPTMTTRKFITYGYDVQRIASIGIRHYDVR